MATIQAALAKVGLVNKHKAEIWEDINVLLPEFRRVKKEMLQTDEQDARAIDRVQFRLQSIKKQLHRLLQLAK